MEFKDYDSWLNWLLFIASENQSIYKGGISGFAQRWANRMEERLKNNSIPGIAQLSCDEADIDGITGNMYGWAVNILSRVWLHGKELLLWHNRKYGEDRVDICINPAILTFRVKA